MEKQPIFLFLFPSFSVLFIYFFFHANCSKNNWNLLFLRKQLQLKHLKKEKLILYVNNVIKVEINEENSLFSENCVFQYPLSTYLLIYFINKPTIPVCVSFFFIDHYIFKMRIHKLFLLFQNKIPKKFSLSFFYPHIICVSVFCSKNVYQ